jgi:hypothetical protein
VDLSEGVLLDGIHRMLSFLEDYQAGSPIQGS